MVNARTVDLLSK